MGTNNTKPEQRVNKLGHVVTKHVVAENYAAKLHRLFPSLAENQVSARHTEMAEILILELGHSFERRYGVDPQMLQKKLSTLSEDTLEIITRASAWSNKLPMPRTKFMNETIYECDEALIRSYMSLRPHFSRAINVPDSSSTRIIQGLHHLEYFKDHDELAGLTGEDLDTAKALLNVTAYLCQYAPESGILSIEDDGYDSIRIASQDLHDLVVEYPEKADMITGFIAERCTGDAGLIRAYIEDGTALDEGIL